jgi:tetratricopeptide (TPR) repeat protein
VEGHGSGALAPGSLVTLGYNRARAREAAGGLRAAAEEYKRILEAFPTYTDCYVRLACIASARGASAEALDWANKALAVQPDNPDVLALLGTVDPLYKTIRPSFYHLFFATSYGQWLLCGCLDEGVPT